MKIEEVEARVEAISKMRADYEVAHSAENDLHQSVLSAIANGAENPAGLAAAALKTLEIDFYRPCA